MAAVRFCNEWRRARGTAADCEKTKEVARRARILYKGTAWLMPGGAPCRTTGKRSFVFFRMVTLTGYRFASGQTVASTLFYPVPQTAPLIKRILTA